MAADYWIETVERLRRRETAWRAACTLSAGLGRGIDLHDTNLGAALACVPREAVIFGVLMAYEDPRAQLCCDQILWYFDPQEVAMVYAAIDSPGAAVRNGLRRLLRRMESPLAGDPESDS